VTGPSARKPAAPPGAVDLIATIAERGTDLRLTVQPGQVVAVLGANGAGKSTPLSLLSGLLHPDTGRITLDGQVLVDTTAGVWVPPHRRKVVLLAQQALLFPHLTAAANVAFGPRSRGAGRRAAQQAADTWLAAVDATEFADRKPAQLSGGQAQRVAIARALAADPALLLLDEPMAALDVAVAPALRHLLRRVLRDTRRTALLVTHDLIAGISDGRHLVTDDGTRIAGLFDPACRTGDPVVAVFRPSAVAVHLTEPTGSPRNHLPVTITELEPRGEIVRVHTAPFPGAGGLLADVTVAAAADLELQPGDRVFAAVKATEITIYPGLGVTDTTAS